MSEPTQKLITKDEAENTELIVKTLNAQHPIHGAFAHVFERLGGEEFLLTWAEDNPDKFLSMLTRMTPALAPGTGDVAERTVTVHAALEESSLDD